MKYILDCIDMEICIDYKAGDFAKTIAMRLRAINILYAHSLFIHSTLTDQLSHVLSALSHPPRLCPWGVSQRLETETEDVQPQLSLTEKIPKISAY